MVLKSRLVKLSSFRSVLTLYKIKTVVNWMRLYSAMYLKTAKLVTNAHRPSRIKWTMHEMSWIADVNGAATLASACDNETPTCAAFNA